MFKLSRFFTEANRNLNLAQDVQALHTAYATFH